MHASRDGIFESDAPADFAVCDAASLPKLADFCGLKGRGWRMRGGSRASPYSPRGRFYAAEQPRAAAQEYLSDAARESFPGYALCSAPAATTHTWRSYALAAKSALRPPSRPYRSEQRIPERRRCCLPLWRVMVAATADFGRPPRTGHSPLAEWASSSDPSFTSEGRPDLVPERQLSIIRQELLRQISPMVALHSRDCTDDDRDPARSR